MKEMTAEEIVINLPSRFIEEEAIGFNATVHLKLSGEGGGEFTIKIDDGTCTYHKGLVGDPDCVVSTSAKTYVNTELGKTNPTMAVMTGKIKVKNVPVLTKFINCFERLNK